MKTVPTTPWLFPEEHSEVVQGLYEFGLLKSSNARNLPLKSGGQTDIYINLREARNNPEAIKFVTSLFSRPLSILQPKRFVEIPDSVSCFAGPLSIMNNIPYLTIREQPKSGRVADAKIIGQPKFGENICLIDDVVTDGASKISPYAECQKLRLKTQALIVLVDRQQGWKKKFAEADINLNVWPGLTLHDVRRQLIESGGMTRCDKEKEEKNPLVVALDGKEWEDLLPMADKLRTTGCILKVNDLLFAQGFGLIPNLSVYGRIMADLKNHDIPNTVANTCRRLKPYHPWAVTIHASGGPAMVKAACNELQGTDTKVLAVTVLTSIDESTCEEIYTRKPLDEVLKLAEIANAAGAHGFVCSPEETAALKEKYPDKEYVNPGVRSPGKDRQDQKRVQTPAGAKENGATKLVMGRQLLDAPDPIIEVNRVLTEELHISF